jgi:hypothetical protein
MFVVLDNSKITCAKTWVLHLKLSHIGFQFAVVMAIILDQLLYLLPFTFMDDPCVVSKTRDKLDTQLLEEA